MKRDIFIGLFLILVLGLGAVVLAPNMMRSRDSANSQIDLNNQLDDFAVVESDDATAQAIDDIAALEFDRLASDQLAELTDDTAQAIDPGGDGTVAIARLSDGGEAQALPQARATRIFGSENQFPPKDFRAYGILAFPARATAATRDRYMVICDAFLQTVPHVTELRDVPRSNQIVTVWPMEAPGDAARANAAPRAETCAIAVDNYGVALAARRLEDARVARPNKIRDTRGPFLIAWNPTSAIGQADQPILVHDLSYVREPEQAEDAMRRWRREIQAGPPNWDAPSKVESLRLTLRNQIDYFGPNGLGIIERIVPETEGEDS